MNNEKLALLQLKLIAMAESAHEKNDIDRLLRLVCGIKDLSDSFRVSGGQEKFTPASKKGGLSA